eukprot:GEMP01039444.1.p1 GENE.GEMP01039444.1~~GEMP01039444.1.p1  ORF type:complete len:227 (+),score=42.88 GEMP01039444.1:344-1024(+)
MLFVTFGTLLASASNQCDASDETVWRQRGRANFHADMSTCGTSCWGKASCVTSCIEGREPFTHPCANCFGDLAGCARYNCMWHCWTGETEACIACVEKYCDPTFKYCSSFDPPRRDTIPPICTENDHQIWWQVGPQKFTHNIATCATSCWGETHCMQICLAKKDQGLSHSCINCFANVGECAADKCMDKCNEDVDKCKVCINSKCAAEMLMCGSPFDPNVGNTVVA